MTLLIRLLIRELGLRSLANYAIYQVALHSGVVKARTKSFQWAERPAAYWLSDSSGTNEPQFFLQSSKLVDSLRGQGSFEKGVQEADEILAGRFRLFGAPPVSLGFPPDWGSPSLGQEKHWTEVSTADSVDLRSLWELSRFGWAFWLARAYVLSGERRYMEGFFELFDSWRLAHPPNFGPQWISAQEVAVRIMALAFVWHAFKETLTDLPDRREDLMVAIAAHADRIPATLRYARAQRNNHLVTEAVGLYTAGLLFPSLRKSAKWKELGREWLSFALADQAFEDGGYIQHSSNYHRVALSAGLWAARLAELNGEPLPSEAIDALRRLTSGLLAMVDMQSGRVPNFGNNDGSDILPLSSGRHSDYRPVLQAASLAFLERAAFSSGPWDEMAHWLGLSYTAARSRNGSRASGDRSLSENDDDGRLEFPQAGLYLLKGRRTWAALRCAQFASRPSHSDQLNVDLWWEGHNIARDRGSLRYTDGKLSTAAAHNALLANRREPMRRMGRFLWLSRYEAQFLGRWRSGDGVSEVIAAEIPLPGKLLHRRSLVRVGEALWVVLDELHGVGMHEARVAWTLPDWRWSLEGAELSLDGDPGRLRLSIEPAAAKLAVYREHKRVAGADLGDDSSTLGWWCPTYAKPEPALSLVAELRGELPLRMSSWWRLGEIDPEQLGLAWSSLEGLPKA